MPFGVGLVTQLEHCGEPGGTEQMEKGGLNLTVKRKSGCLSWETFLLTK